MNEWLEQRLAAIGICMRARSQEAALALLYSGIDTLAFLNSPTNQLEVQRDDFIDWCDQYLVPLLGTFTGIDLYGARCGVLHTSSASSRLGREGKAREIWYRFEGQVGVNLGASLPKLPMYLDIGKFVAAFEKASRQFIDDLHEDSERLKIAQERAGRHFTWGVQVRRPGYSE